MRASKLIELSSSGCLAANWRRCARHYVLDCSDFQINAFYLVKERDLRLRLLTLLTNRKRLLHRSRTGGAADVDTDMVEGDSRSSRKGLEWESLEEGWRLFERDLGKLQVRWANSCCYHVLI